MNDVELYIISLFYAGYNLEFIKNIVKNDNTDHIINKHDNFELIDSKNTINLY